MPRAPKTTPAPPAPATPRARFSKLCLLRAAAVVFVVAMVAWRWAPDTGFTGLLGFSERYVPRRLPVLAGLPLATTAGGYDGQFYAQIAVAPDVTAAPLHTALDLPSYRARRILLPLAAYAAGLGQPWWVLNAYALLNLIVWLALARVWWQETRGAGEVRGTAIWLASLLSLGALDSVRQALTDLPATLLLVLAVRASRQARPLLAVAWFVAAGFVRETSVLAAGILRFGPEADAPARLRAWTLRGLCVLPMVFWAAWLHVNLPGQAGIEGNFDWPGRALARHLWTCAGALAEGNFDSRYSWGLVGALCLAYQSLFLLRRWRTDDPWVRLGLPFALLFWVLGENVFNGYWAVARVCLPLTFAFNILLPRDGAFYPRLALGNLFALHGLWRMLP